MTAARQCGPGDSLQNTVPTRVSTGPHKHAATLTSKSTATAKTTQPSGTRFTGATAQDPEQDDTSKVAPPYADTPYEPPLVSPSFAYFTRLPSEIRFLVWREAYLEHLASQPCVCIYQGGTIPIGDEDDTSKMAGAGMASRGVRYNHAPPRVHPESALLETVCREARLTCIAQRGIRNAPNQAELAPASHGKAESAAGSEVGILPPLRLPSRVFDTAKDILYIDRQKRHGDGSTIVFYLGDRTQWVRHVRHIALPFSLALDIAWQPALLRHLTSLETISLVFPLNIHSAHNPRAPSQELQRREVMLWSSITLPSPTPTQRLSLRTLTAEELEELRVKDDPRRPPSTLVGRNWARGGETGRAFIELVKSSIGNRIRRTDEYSKELQRFYWTPDGSFKFEIEGCVFL
ncbi:uncharacterized protein B0I36DRAFT_368123 [Microdochium trichocladiopsis]|uniref:Uncharacterized protein n=1 Tax=Microdochium trichocladiopsis TaxID=1682393 RepID=A0A9P9BJG7_9PEZI|nr:uncharacterized protein B0I36DRAFT_368123 [Microdochium trichocladiopsis]KAH7018075.1 hypothetical protein B0I36DRAFT_368123 [Microdochium trichocladiopsis]